MTGVEAHDMLEVSDGRGQGYGESTQAEMGTVFERVDKTILFL